MKQSGLEIPVFRYDQVGNLLTGSIINLIGRTPSFIAMLLDLPGFPPVLDISSEG